MKSFNSSKMAWFINDKLNDLLPHEIYNTGESFGYIEKPTGAGKSGVMYDDIILRYEDILSQENNKLIINISCPVLKLDEQIINDLIECLYYIYNEWSIDFFLNSSDNGNSYSSISMLKKDINRFNEFDKFMQSKSKMAVVISCHKSLHKFVNKIAELRKDKKNNRFISVSYIDEAHKIDTNRENNADDSISYIDMTTLCNCSNAVYLISATPDVSSIQFINQYNSFGKEGIQRIIRTTQAQAIQENVIVKPAFHIALTEAVHLECKMIVTALEHAKKENPHIHHKLLVTMSESEELRNMATKLMKLGYRVFYTCAKYGMHGNEKDSSEFKNIDDIVSFIREVDECEDDCVVMHIKQLTQGIDIKSITDVVAFENDIADPSGHMSSVQTIGRAQRTLRNERGVSEEFRRKKHCNIYYFIPNKDVGAVGYIREFFMRVYGVCNMTFDWHRYDSEGFRSIDEVDFNKRIRLTNGSSFTPIQELKLNMEEYVKHKLLSDIKIYGLIGKEFIVKDEINRVLEDCDCFNREFTCNELLDNTELINHIIALFEKYDIDKYAGQI